MINLSEWEDYKISNDKVKVVERLQSEGHLFGNRLLKEGVSMHLQCGIIIKDDLPRVEAILNS